MSVLEGLSVAIVPHVVIKIVLLFLFANSELFDILFIHLQIGVLMLYNCQNVYIKGKVIFTLPKIFE